MSTHVQTTLAAVSIPTATNQSRRRPIFAWQAAKICDISDRAIRAAAEAGRLHGFKLSDTPKLWRFWRSDVESYRDQRAHSRRWRPPSRNQQLPVLSSFVPHQHWGDRL